MTREQLTTLRTAAEAPYRPGIDALGSGAFCYSEGGETAPRRAVLALIEAGLLLFRGGRWRVSKAGREALKEASS